MENNESRRNFIGKVGAVSAAGVLLNTQSPALAGPNPPPPVDLPRRLQPSRADIGSLFADIERLARRGNFPYSFLSGRFKTLEEFKTAGREKVLEAFGSQPAAVKPQAQILSRQDLGDFIREKIVFSTTPEFRVPAYVHIPKKGKPPFPAVVDLHSHGGMFLFGKEKIVDLGHNHPVMDDYHRRVYGGRATSTALVRRGYVVICIDAFAFGERRLIMDDDIKHGYDRSKYSVKTAMYLNGKCRGKESTLAKSLTLAGATWPGIVTWDDMRTVDYLITRPEVDAKRIGCLGVSLGGHRTLYLAGMDERIAAACVVGFMSTVKPMIQAHIDTHSWVHFVPGLHQFLDMPDVVSMMAPKPLLVQQCRQDGLYPLSGMQESVAKIAKVYERAKVKNRFTGRFFAGRHRFDQKMQNEAFQWLDRQLKP